MRTNREILASVYKAHGLTLLANEIERIEGLDDSRLDSIIVRTSLQAMQVARDEEHERVQQSLDHLAQANRAFADENHELKRQLKEH